MKYLRKYVHIIAVLVCVGTFLLSVKAEADTAYPTTIHDVESVGTYHWDDGTNHIDIYASDIQNLHNELYSLGTYSADTFAGYSARLAAIDTTVTNGKQSVATKIKAYDSSASVSGSSTYAQLANALAGVYNKGKAAGESAAKAEIAAHPNDAFTDYMYNGGHLAADEDHTYTNPYGKECYVTAACGGNPDSGYANVNGAYVYVNGVLKSGGSGHTSASWSGMIPSGAKVRIRTDGSHGTGHGNSYGRVIFVR